MEEKKRNIPSIRFQSYSDDWEQRKLGESCRIGDIDHRMPKSVTEGVPYLMTGDFIGENKLNFENTKLVSIEDYDQLSKKIKPEYGDILFARYASVGAVRYVDIQRKFLISYSCAIMKPNIDIKGLFLYQLLQTDFMKRKIEFEINPNSQKNIGIDSLKKLKISIPIIEEQEKIGKFFKDLDNTIALHQRKLEILKNSKQTLLQKMFPQTDENVPEIRFSGFTEDWEQRRLKEITERVRGNDGRMDLPTLTISAGSGWLDQRERFSGNIAGKEQKNYTLLKKGQLSYNHGNSKLAKYGAVFELKTYNEALVPRVYHSFGTNELSNPNFIEYMFVTKRPDKELAKLVSSGARMDGLLNINFDEFMGINVNIPSVGEQKKIGSFFEQLDDIIALHQHELETLKQLKQTLLNQMFI